MPNDQQIKPVLSSRFKRKNSIRCAQYDPRAVYVELPGIGVNVPTFVSTRI